MNAPIRLIAVLAGPALLLAQAVAQTPGQSPAPAPAAAPAQAAPGRPQAWTQAQHPRRQSIVHHYPYPYPEAYHGDEYGGFRNPGGTGRYLEYYPPGDRFQLSEARAQDPVRVATFGGGGIPDRNEQLAAQQVGIARYNAIQGHIDRMAQPMYGFGFFGGFN
jgi:hypothetical protein